MVIGNLISNFFDNKFFCNGIIILVSKSCNTLTMSSNKSRFDVIRLFVQNKELNKNNGLGGLGIF